MSEAHRSDPPLLAIDGLKVAFPAEGGSFMAVDDVSFEIRETESLAIIGESGSGKSVTAGTVMGLVDSPPARIGGDIRFRGESLVTMPAKRRRMLYGTDIGMVFQDPLAHLNPVYPVGWQIAEVCRIHGMGRREAQERTADLMHRVGIPDPRKRADAYPHEFSGGQRQRIMIAMAVALEPKLLIADEPTTALDVTVQAQILDLLRRLSDETGMALLMITHDLGVAADISERVLVMRRGEIVEQGDIRSVFSKPQHPYTRRLLANRFEEYRSPAPAAADPAIELRNVGIRYGHFQAVQDVSVTLGRGEILGVVGESGSGKSSLASAVLRLRQPSEGQVLFHGEDVFALTGKPLRTYRRKVQAVFQDPYSSLNPRMTVLKILSEPWLLNPGVVEKARWHARAAELLEMVGLSPSDLAKYPGEFSGGQRQRIAIARALALEPEVIVCDEAVSALDMTIQTQVIKLLADLRRDLGLSYFFIAHDLALVENFADRVLVMKDGRVVEEGTSREVFADPRHPYTRDLIASHPVPDPVAQKERRQDASRGAAAAAPKPVRHGATGGR